MGVILDPNRALNELNRLNDVALSASQLIILGTGVPALSVSPVSRFVTAESGITSFTIRNAGGGTLSWSASIPSAPWLHFISTNSGVAEVNGSVLIVSCDSNPSSSARTGSIIISAPGASPDSQEVTVTQLGAPSPPPEVTHLEFSLIPSPQTVNVPFAVTISAMNSNVQPPQVQTAFNGRVDLRSEAGGHANLRYIELQNGVWNGDLSLDTPAVQTVLVGATTAAGPVQGRSNPFDIQSAAPAIGKVIVKVVQPDGITPIEGATVWLTKFPETPKQLQTDSDGLAQFNASGAGTYYINATKEGFPDGSGSVEFRGFCVLKVVTMCSRKPPVLLVPGILGSCSEIGKRGWYPAPVLPVEYPSPRGSLKLFNPSVFWVHDPVGWEKLRELLKRDFQVIDVPWDWRVPVIEPDGKNLAWRIYLKPAIEAATNCTGYSKVDIVAHSMGGLLTRAYIENATEFGNDIGRFAMVGTPNEGSATAYYKWFGGETKGDALAEVASEVNYKRWTGGKWDSKNPSQAKKLQFYQTWIKALKELLPVYPPASST